MIIDLPSAKSKLRHGELVAVPTDTIYGIAADMYHEEAILKLYNLKGRSFEKPFVIQLAAPRDLFAYLSFIPYDLEKIIQHFWPGPLTLVLPVNEKKVPANIRAHLPTAAFRLANNQILRQLILEHGPLVVTSANLSGDKELLTSQEIEKVFGADFPVLTSPDESFSGTPSTILAYIDACWVILRKGGIPLKDLRHVIGYNPPVVSKVDFNAKTYHVLTQLHCMDCPYDGSINIVIGFEDRDYPKAERVIHIGKISKPSEIRSEIIKITHELKNEAYSHVWVDMDFPKTGPLKEVARILERSFQTDE